MRKLRRVVISALALIVIAVAVRAAMPLAGRFLIHADPLKRADVIVILGGNRLERTLEAGTLFREGWAKQVALLRPHDLGRRGILTQLGVTVPVFFDVQKQALSQMGVPVAAVIEVPDVADTTRGEAATFADRARHDRWTRAIVVTSPYHTRRAALHFRRAARGSFEVIIRPSRYEGTDPDHWWRSGVDRTDVVFEYIKTLRGIFQR